MKLSLASGRVVDMPDVPDGATMEPLTIDFGIKSTVEVEIDGQIGLLTKGYASRFNETDQDGEHQARGAFADLMDAWAAEPAPMVIFHHGLDAALGARRIGRGIKAHLDSEGFYAETFIPKDPAFKNVGARRRFAEVYAGIKAGTINGYSVGGGFIRAGKALVRWATTELSITPTPCLETATFALGRKALIDAYGELPPSLSVADGDANVDGQGEGDDDGLVDQATLPMLSRPAWSQAMSMAQTQGDESLHDHLLYRPAHFQGAHTPDSCPICTMQRRRQGVKAAAPARAGTTPTGGDGKKAALAALLRDRPDLLRSATQMLQEVGHGGKIGKRHSKKDLEVVGGIISVLETHFGLGDGDGAADDADDTGTGSATGGAAS